MNSDADFMNKAREIAEKHSHDRSTKVGCVIVNRNDEIAVMGVNAFPHGVNRDVDARHERPEKYKWIEHAERNAIYGAAVAGISLAGCRIYLPWFPCMDRARAIIQSGIVEMIAVQPDLNDSRWGEDFKRVGTLMSEAGIPVRFLCEPVA